MNLEIKDVQVSRGTLTPSLMFFIDFTFRSGVEMPISLLGEVAIPNGKKIGRIEDYNLNFNSENSVRNKILDNHQTLNNNIYGGKLDSFSTTVILELSPLAINYIEERRNLNREKDITFELKLSVKMLRTIITGNILRGYMGNIGKDGYNFQEVLSKNHSQIYTISQSDWINNFSKPLGIGNFVLHEIDNIPSTPANKDWAERFNRLQAIIEVMKKKVRENDWEAVLKEARQYFELIKFAKNQKGLHESMKAKFIIRNQSEVGFAEFSESLTQSFIYLSKFIHETDPKGNIQPKPVAKKEDAEFTYELCVSLTKYISKKLR